MGRSYFGTYNVRKVKKFITLPDEILEKIKKKNEGNDFLYACPLMCEKEISIVYFDADSYRQFECELRTDVDGLILDANEKAAIILMASEAKKAVLDGKRLEIPKGLEKIVKGRRLLLVGCKNVFELWKPDAYNMWCPVVKYEAAAENL